MSKPSLIGNNSTALRAPVFWNLSIQTQIWNHLNYWGRSMTAHLPYCSAPFNKIPIFRTQIPKQTFACKWRGGLTTQHSDKPLRRFCVTAETKGRFCGSAECRWALPEVSKGKGRVTQHGDFLRTSFSTFIARLIKEKEKAVLLNVMRSKGIC